MDSQRFSDEDVPSAPPFCGSGGEIKLDRETSPAPKRQYLFSMEAEKNTLGRRSPATGEQDSVRQDTCDSTVRFVCLYGICCIDLGGIWIKGVRIGNGYVYHK